MARKVIGELLARPATPRLPSVPTQQQIDASGREAMSERVLEVLRLATRGLSNREIGA